MKKYQSNIFRKAMAVLLVVLAVMCATNVWAQTYTLTSSKGTSVASDVDKTTITATVSPVAKFLLYKNSDYLGVYTQTSATEEVDLDYGDNFFYLYLWDLYNL